MPSQATLGKFGHHPNPEIDAEVEIERLTGGLASAHAGLIRALDYRAATPEGLSIKETVRWALTDSGYVGSFGTRQEF